MKRGGIRELGAKPEDKQTGCAGAKAQLPITNSQQQKCRQAVLDPSGNVLEWKPLRYRRPAKSKRSSSCREGPTRIGAENKAVPSSRGCGIEMPERIAVLDQLGEHLFWTDENGARELLKKNQARLIRRRNKARTLRATTSDLSSFQGLTLGGRGDAFSKTRYSHNHESQDNIEKVWTLKRLPKHTRPIFTEVLESCMAKAA